MATVIGVRFKKAGKVYYFDPNGLWPKPGENVVVETARGVEYGEAVTSPRTVDDAQVVQPLKKVVRIATEEDTRRAEQNAQHEIEAFKICQDRVKKHKLDMKLVSVEHTFDNSKIIFYFTADGRVDFRELVKDLASVFKMRIELRQIGVRDEAKMLGGLGSCGRPICCGAFLGDFQPVSIKMAKEQGLSLNPTKISGLCGRLMCCLKYEQDNYEAVLKRLPKIGKDLVTPDGVGVLTEINAIREMVKVRIRTAEDTFDLREYPIDDVRKPGPGDAAAVREAPKPKPQRPKKGAEPEPETPAEEEKPKRKVYPHQKAPKNLSTDQFLEKLRESATVVPESVRERRNADFETEMKNPDSEAMRERRKRRRGAKNRRGDEVQGESAPAESESAVKPEKASEPMSAPEKNVEAPYATEKNVESADAPEA